MRPMLPQSQGVYARLHGQACPQKAPDFLGFCAIFAQAKKPVALNGDKGNNRDMTNEAGKSARLLTTAEVARHYGVTPKTIRRWVAIGALQAARTLGGHRRFLPSVVKGEGGK